MTNLKQSWFTLSCLQLSGALSLPVIMLGYYLGQHHSLRECLLQLVLGNLILFSLAAFYMLVISRRKMVTIEFAQCLFGPLGTFFCAAGMVISLLGWSAIQIHLITASTAYPALSGLVVALVVYLLTCKDLTYLARANKLLLPLIGLSLLYLIRVAPQTTSLANLIQPNPFRLGLMMVIMAGSGLVFDLPTFYRHAATTKNGLGSLALVFILALPVIEGSGIYLALHYGGSEGWIQGFLKSFSMPALFFLMLSGLFGSCLNLYSATIIINRTLGFSYKMTLALCCLLASLLANIDLEHELAVFLELINLTAEIVTALILIYVLFRGRDLPQPSGNEKRMHQVIFFLTLGYAVGSKFFRFNLFDDLILDTAFISCLLLSFYYFSRLFLVEMIVGATGGRPV